MPAVMLCSTMLPAATRATERVTCATTQTRCKRLLPVARGVAAFNAPPGSVREAVLSIDKNQPLSETTTMEEVIAKSVAPRRFRMLLLGLFALLALSLAMIGVYGVIAYSSTQRTHEFGVRIALGADRQDILRLVVRQGFKLALLGVTMGVAGALLVTRFLSSLLYEVSPHDPLTFAGVAALLMLVALAASYIPARRAMKLDPIVALRYE